MTVSTTDSVIEHVSGGPAYPIPYRFLQNSDIQAVLVKQDGTSETLALGTQYTLVGAGTQSGGTLTSAYVAGYLATPGASLTIARIMTPVQPTDLRNQGRFLAETHEFVFDRLTMLVQQGFTLSNRALIRPAGRDYFYAENRRIANVQDPIDLQDAATSGWVGQFIGDLIGTGQGPINSAENVLYQKPNGQPTTVQAMSAQDGADLIGFIQAGAGAVPRTLLSKGRDQLSAKDFGVVADGIADDTAKLQLAINAARSFSKTLYIPKGTYKTSSELNISGVRIVGDALGYRNGNGTVIQGSGTHDIFTQSTATLDDTWIELHDMRIKGGLWGVKCRYMISSEWSNVVITDCQNGIQIGNSTDAGPLLNMFKHIDIDVVDTALDLNGNGFVNSNVFNQCQFKGLQFAARVRCTGGIGAVGNVFNSTNFMGDRYGATVENTKNTAFNECYFESHGPSVGFLGVNLGWSFDDCTFAGLRNDNPTTKTSFLYHFVGDVCRGSVKGGYVYIPAGTVFNNQSLLASEDPANFFANLVDEPEQDVAASGFVIFNTSLLSQNLIYSKASTYTPTWSGTVGNGTLRGRYVREGNIVTVSLYLLFGTTTAPGGTFWTFGLPFTSRENAVGSVLMRDAGTSFYTGVAALNSGANIFAININGSANLVGPTVPFTWGSTDDISITLTYQC